jgi:hypothetical protein
MICRGRRFTPLSTKSSSLLYIMCNDLRIHIKILLIFMEKTCYRDAKIARSFVTYYKTYVPAAFNAQQFSAMVTRNCVMTVINLTFTELSYTRRIFHRSPLWEVLKCHRTLFSKLRKQRFAQKCGS